jgi:polysaccharide export outer membrane protein
VDPGYTRLLESGQGGLPNADALGPDDKISLRVYQDESLNGEFVVAPDGTINFPLIGKVAALGKTCPQLEDALAAKLAAGYIRDPSVTCSVLEANSKKIFVLGEVKTPGSFRYEKDMRVVQAVTAAGGFSPLADPSATTLTRLVGGEQVKATVPMEAIVAGEIENLELQPGDIIFVPKSPI